MEVGVPAPSSPPGWSRRDFLGAAVGAGLAGWEGASAGLGGSDAGGGAVAVRRTTRSADLTALADELVTKHRIPGALVGTLQRGEVSFGAAGVANLNTGLPMTEDTGFLTGSITKVWTSTLVMTFVDDGTIDLDRPVSGYLPHFRWAGGAITTRQLLNHSSGLDAGDYLLELGAGPEAHRRYADLLTRVDAIHRPGAYSSYCNGGFILAGHLIEYLTGKSFDQLLRERVIGPLGLERTVTSADEAILHRTAVGSLPDPERPGAHRVTPKFLLPRSAAPAGATLITTLADQLEFAAMHLGAGRGRRGTRVLSEASAGAMATRTIGRPVGSGGFGLGWGVSGLPGAIRLSHSGGSNGGIAQLVVIPGDQFAFASFANSSSSYGFHAELQQRVMATAGSNRPASPPRPEVVAKPAALESRLVLGRYRRMSQWISIEAEGSRLVAEVTVVPEEFHGSEVYNLGQKRRFEVIPTGPSQLASVEPVLLGQTMTFDFFDPAADGRFGRVYSAGRLSRRAE
ncbi:MAG: serine hydrolase domain-containing protein [Gemmatimonadales bacterium]